MNAVKTYDVIIIGAGPAGIFTALELADTGLSILIVEKGQDIRERIATSRNKNALPKDKVRNVVCGWGGAGAFSDGKLTLTTEYGGNLDDYMSKAELMEKIAYVDDVYCRFGGADRKVYGDENKECIRQMQRKADEWNDRYQGKDAPAPDEAALAQRRELNEYFEQYRRRVDDCLRPASEKAVEVEVEVLSQEAFGRLLASNPEWTAQDAMRAMETVVN